MNFTTKKNNLSDSYGRRINYLRISLTEDCNFRCLYCLPPEGIPQKRSANYLNPNEIFRFVRVAVSMGISRVRLTGGEPLLRQDLLKIVSCLSRIEGLKEISLTTNGYFLATQAKKLKKAGLHRINLSLDSLEAKRFHAMTRSKGLGRVFRGMEAAVLAGLPIKINVVILKGINDGEILPFVDFALEHGLEVRFLEFMPLCGSGWSSNLVQPVAQIRNEVESHYFLIEEPRGDAPAQTFRLRQGAREAKVGFIGPLSEPFCDACSRMRLSADGKIQPCLFSSDRWDVREYLQEEGSKDVLENRIRQAVGNKSRGSQYMKIEEEGRGEEYMKAYAGREEKNPLIHDIGG